MLIDTHCHLDFPDFGAERDAIVARAHAAGIGRMITISTRVDRYDDYKAIAETYDTVWFTVGTHPHQAHEEPEASLDTIVALAAHPRCVGIGEAGLDFHYDRSPRDTAERVFRTHIAAARKCRLPLVIHTRDADAETARILAEEMANGPFQAVLHCFTSGAELARAAVALGLYVSFSGVVTFKNAEALRGIAADVPIDRILVETDAPFLAPVPYRGKRNEPAFVAATAAALAQALSIEPSAIAAATTANALRLFSKMPAMPA